ncbi:histidine triad nucleotide-binding protein [Agaribacterium haliotis]|uniref:histidine triad nucleotide-binding protein n=1 Tax=Agaribacterium haliotis TaxID=2013869 RepID=UPI000BB55EA7|nr:histidine triad nucleotide-binding protein [Agaribacterium haliotis]
MSEPSIFSRIMAGEIPADILYEDEDCICINDIQPQAPTHVLIIPRKAIARLADATAEDKALLGALMLRVGDIARKLGVDDAFRVCINNGERAGQTVFHLHIHLLAGKSFSEGSLSMQ